MTGDPKAKTYVFIGSDMFEPEAQAYLTRPDCIVIRAKDHESFDQAVQRAHIQTPANIIIDCHGSVNGTFCWNHEQYTGKEAGTSYKAAFGLLPQGTQTIVLGSCFGGTAQDYLSAAPSGAIVQSHISRMNVGTTAVGIFFAKETQGLTNPVDLYLEALDNFTPDVYKKVVEYWNKHDNRHDLTDPDWAMPTILGIGGHPPIRIDIDNITRILGNELTQGTGDQAAWQRAQARVMDRFDTKHFIVAGDTEVANEAGNGMFAEMALDARIAKVADKMQHGKPLLQAYTPEGCDEKRIALALTAAYLEESGQLDAWVKATKSNGLVTMPFSTKVVPHNEALEDRYLNSHAQHGGFINKRYDEWVLTVQLQESLDRVLDHKTPTSTGHYDAATEKSVREVQTQYGLRLDGVAGKQTITTLEVLELGKIVDAKANGAEILKEAQDVNALLGKKLPPKVQHELEQIMIKLDHSGVVQTNSELAKVVHSIKEKAGITH